MSASAEDWLRASQTALVDRLAGLKRDLARRSGQAGTAGGAASSEARSDAEAGAPSALARLTETFDLSPFERDILALCAGMELDPELPAACAAAQRDPARPHPTFGLMLSAFDEGHWSALSPDAPLRRWRLIDVANGPVLTQAPLRIDERVLHHLVGVDHLDQRLAALIDPIAPVAAETLVPSQAVVAERVAEIWSRSARGQDMTVVQLSGAAADCRPIAAAAAGLLGLRAASLAAERLPVNANDLDSLLRLWEREAALSGLGVLMVDCDDYLSAETDAGRARGAAVALLLERAGGPVILREREPRRIAMRPATILEASHPTAAEQLSIWRECLGPSVSAEALATTAAQFSLGPPTIRSIAGEARARAADWPADAAATVWELCRHRLRSALDGLARRIDSRFEWDDLVLPAEQKRTLRAIAAQLRQRATVHDLWGFAHKSRRGLGISALFHGPSGTGKTMAAEVLASELRLDLYHIDLSHIVSKYIGETEANLRRVFDAAEENGAILLFDEADSLFGTRSQVKDSHDRYANIEVSYLLQRMEAYRGLAILTTNMRSALDPAFMRRIRFAVRFPFPEAPQRAAIWRKVFPAEADTQDLDHDRLARLQIAGGNIRNIALNAAFIAADAGEPIGMAHLRDAVSTEYVKLGRRLTQAESEAWA